MKQLKQILSGAIFFFTLVATAQNGTLQISAELRSRTIVDNGYQTPLSKVEGSTVYTTQRTRLNTLFSNDKFETYISLQDVRLLGADDNYNSSGMYGNTESLSLHQAWVKLKIIEPLSLKIGRQIFSYDDQRIISARSWNDYQVTYDALLAEYKTGKHRLHLGLTYNADNKTNGLFPNMKFKVFDFLHHQYQLDNFTISSIVLATGNTLTDTTEQVLYKGTYGVNANYKNNLVTARLSTYYQHNLNDISGTISAFCISAYAEHKLIKKISFALGYDYLSGNDDVTKGTINKRFDILYGSRHGWYGYMDYFSTTPQQGLQDYIAKLTYKPKKDVIIEFYYHYFMLAADKFDSLNSTEKLKRQLGQELDLRLKWEFHQMATLECGYSIFGYTKTLEQLKEVNGENLKTPQFCYITITIKPLVVF